MVWVATSRKSTGRIKVKDNNRQEQGGVGENGIEEEIGGVGIYLDILVWRFYNNKSTQLKRRWDTEISSHHTIETRVVAFRVRNKGNNDI